jgi:acetoacetyl-CoA synthetase
MTEITPDLRRKNRLWEPCPESIARTNLTRYLNWLAEKRDLKFADYPKLWTWSTNEPGAFWSSIADFFEVRFHQPAECALSSTEMPGARWFCGATLNYAEHALRSGTGEGDAVILFEAEAAGGQIGGRRFPGLNSKNRLPWSQPGCAPWA